MIAAILTVIILLSLALGTLLTILAGVDDDRSTMRPAIFFFGVAFLAHVGGLLLNGSAVLS